jgi:hypothetical protein
MTHEKLRAEMEAAAKLPSYENLLYENLLYAIDAAQAAAGGGSAFAVAPAPGSDEALELEAILREETQ